jgi:molybdopterin-guanine dinucleotide biosynthesis protein MobB
MIRPEIRPNTRRPIRLAAERRLLDLPRPGARRRPPVLVVGGHSGAGKTTLLDRLIAYLAGQGWRVGAIKHDPKGHAIYDQPGKDSWRYRRAGAAAVALSGPTDIAMFRPATQDTPLAELVDQLAAAAPLDLVLAEGYNDEPAVPKLEVFRPELGRPLRCAPGDLLAVVTDAPNEVAPGIKQLLPHDVAAVAGFLVTCLLRERDVRV